MKEQIINEQLSTTKIWSLFYYFMFKNIIIMKKVTLNSNRFFITLSIILFSIGTIQSQETGKVISKEIRALKSSGVKFEEVKLFQKSSEIPSTLKSKISDASYMDFKSEKVNNIKTSNPKFLSLQLPLENEKTITLNLYQVDILAPSSKERAKSFIGLFYRGVVEGDNESLAAINLYDNEMSGIVQYEGVVYTLGKIESEEKTHIFYPEANQLWSQEMSCNMPDDIEEEYSYNELYMPPSLEQTEGDCLTIEFSIHHTLTDRLGGENAAQNYGTGVFNNHATLCSNDGFAVTLNELKIWTNSNPAPYSVNGYGTLDNWQYATGSINGTVAYCAFYQSGFGGGVAASFQGICNSNPDRSKSVGRHNGTYEQVPTYSFDVFLMSHELGHLYGSYHTHACAWNGNNTAIDGCAGGVEGNCGNPGPASPGTIMSYCAPDVDFNEGYHPQVQSVILNNIAYATCTTACQDPSCDDGFQNGDETGIDCGGSCPNECPTCNDGIQNGDEDDVDCGGSFCPICPCNGNAVAVKINFDNYPEEISWTMKTQNGSTVASGDNYGNEADGSTFTEELCLQDGCYDFTINDTYGDGLCCSYGNGSYSIVDENGANLASGGTFNYSETTDFCVEGGGGPAPTCNDGIQNGNETGVDCGGSCSACPTCNDGIQNGNETGVDCGGVCSACPTCNDGIQNGNETGVDCGGICSACPTCNDGMQNGTETGVDCGGICSPCPTCNDGIQNGNETGVDCGGICSPCIACDPGTPCDDDDVCTINDVYDQDCECVGEYIDTDYDRICDAEDPCPSDPDLDCQGELEYCDSQGNNSYYEYIDRVKFGNVDNVSGNDQGYGDYTDQITIVGRGDTIPLGLVPGFLRIAYDEAWNVWIDFNADGTFDDLTENVYYGISSGALLGNVEIPSTATLGKTRMRISMQWQRLSMPCEIFDFGEVEDYTVDITDTPQNYVPLEFRNDAGLSSGPAIRISPNPATDFVNVGLQGAREGGSIQLIDLSGRILWQEAVGVEIDNLQIPTDYLPAGIYFIRLNFGNSTYATERFIKISK